MHRIAAKVIALRGAQNRMVCALLCALEIALNETRPAMSSATSHSRRWLHVAAEGATLREFHLQSGGVELKTCWKWCKGKKRAHSASEKGLIRKEKRLKWNVEKKILIRTPSIACLLKSSLSSSFSLQSDESLHLAPDFLHNPRDGRCDLIICKTCDPSSLHSNSLLENLKATEIQQVRRNNRC